MKKLKSTMVVFLLLMFTFPIAAQEHSSNETSWEVDELWEFHETIYQLWHTAWPEKDTEMLISLLPDVEAGYESIVNVDLPGILRDKKAKWDDNVAKLGAVVVDYKTAAGEKDKQALLDAAEKVHTYFEMLVRTIRPVTKEVDAFHQVLYTLYHYDTVNYDYEKIQSSVAKLKTKMTELNKAELPERKKDKAEAFSNAKQQLSNAVDNLCKVVKTGDDKEMIITAVDKMHTKYQELEKVFD